jgi:hypothetical protein
MGMQSLKDMSEMKWTFKSTLMYQTSQHLQTDSDHAFKKQMSFQETSQICSTTNSINLTQILSLTLCSFFSSLGLSTNQSLSSHLSLRHRCQLFRQLCFHPPLRSYHPQVLTFSTWMNNLLQKSNTLPFLMYCM